MLLDIEKTNEGEWFPFFTSSVSNTGEVVYDDPTGDAKVLVRSIAPIIEERLALRKKKYENVLNPVARTMERISYYEEQTVEQLKKEREDVWDYAIMDFKNFTDKNGKIIECNRENKLKMMALPVFDRFIARCLFLINSEGARSKEAELKNS